MGNSSDYPPACRVAYATTGVSNVSVIDTANNTVIANPTVGTSTFGIDLTPNGASAYVSNVFGNNVLVLATASNTVVTSVDRWRWLA